MNVFCVDPSPKKRSSEKQNFFSVLISCFLSVHFHAHLHFFPSTHTPLKTTKKSEEKFSIFFLRSFYPPLNSLVLVFMCDSGGHRDHLFFFKNPSRESEKKKKFFFNNKKSRSFFSLKKHTQSTDTFF